MNTNDLAKAGFATKYAPDAKRAIWEYTIEGNTTTKAPRLKVTVNKDGAFKCGVHGCGCAFVNTTNYDLPRFAQLLRGLKHDNYAKLVEKYLEKEARADAMADMQGTDSDAFGALGYYE